MIETYLYNEEDPKKQKTEIKKYTGALSVIIKKLSNKKYHEIIDEDSGLNLSPDFIVLFFLLKILQKYFIMQDLT